MLRRRTESFKKYSSAPKVRAKFTESAGPQAKVRWHSQFYEGNTNSQLWRTGSVAARRSAAPTAEGRRTAHPRSCRRRKSARLEGAIWFVEWERATRASTYSRLGRLGS